MPKIQVERSPPLGRGLRGGFCDESIKTEDTKLEALLLKVKTPRWELTEMYSAMTTRESA